jgi:heme A synthase
MAEDPQLKMLFDYTVFHIGLYVSLVTALLAAMNFHESQKRYLLLLVPLGLLVGAGACGGIVGSSISNYTKYSESDPAKSPGFMESTYESFGVNTTFRKWVTYEHRFFWSAVVAAVVVFAWFSFFPTKKTSKKTTITIQAENATINTDVPA